MMLCSGKDCEVEGVLSRRQTSRQRVAWPRLHFDLRPRSSGSEHWMKTFRPRISPMGLGHGNWEGGRDRVLSGTAVANAQL
jgi:hypothetical protein